MSVVDDSLHGRVLVAGSIAFDNIMYFDGKFQDHILPDRLDSINLSFLVKNSRRERGGCAGNIGYSLALLGERPRLVATAGNDFAQYGEYLQGIGVDVSCVRVYPEEQTATCTITSDKCSNQLTFVSTGAMSRAHELNIMDYVTAATRLAIVAPDDPEAMQKHTGDARKAGLPFIYDPSFQVIAFNGEQLLCGADGARALILNDYEFSLFVDKTGLSLDELRQRIELIVVTKGGEGCCIYERNGNDVCVPSVSGVTVNDPTGAGDAFRAGLIYGLLRDYSLEDCARLGNVCGAYAVESRGTQNFRYSLQEFSDRYQAAYGKPAPIQVED